MQINKSNKNSLGRFVSEQASNTKTFFIILIALLILLLSNPSIAEIQDIEINDTFYLFDEINLNVLMNNTAGFDMWTYAECSFKDPDNEVVTASSHCYLINRYEKKQIIVPNVVNKPGVWKLHDCTAFASLQTECTDAVPQHTYKLDPPREIEVKAKPVSVKITSPGEGAEVFRNVKIEAIAQGDYEKAEVAYTDGECEYAEKHEINIPDRNAPIVWTWDTVGSGFAATDGEYNICLWVSGYGHSDFDKTTVVLNNYDFEFNPLTTSNQEVSAGESIDLHFTLKNTGKVTDTYEIDATTSSVGRRWDTVVIVDGEQKPEHISIDANQEKDVILRINVPYVDIGSVGVLVVDITNSVGDKRHTEHEMKVGDALNRPPTISEISHDPAEIEEGMPVTFSAKIKDYDNDVVKSAEVCLDKDCQNKLCSMNYDINTGKYQCLSISIAELTEGSYDFYIVATDAVGGTGTAKSEFVIVKSDKITILNPTFGEHVKGIVDVEVDIYFDMALPTVQFGLSDSPMCENVEYNKMIKNSGLYIYSWDSKKTSDGKKFICIRATGNGRTKTSSRLVYIDNYNFDLNAYYSEVLLLTGTTTDVSFYLNNTGVDEVFDMLLSLDNTDDFEIVSTSINSQLSQLGSYALKNQEGLNITAKVYIKTTATTQDKGKLELEVESKNTAEKKIASTRINVGDLNNPPEIPNADFYTSPEKVVYGNEVRVYVKDIIDKDGDGIDERDVCADENCTNILCSLRHISSTDYKYTCSYSANMTPGLHNYYIYLLDERGAFSKYSSSIFIKEDIPQPLCTGTFSDGKYECRLFEQCVDTNFPPPCYKAEILGTGGCVANKVCCKLTERGCGDLGCKTNIVSRTCVYDKSANKYDVFTGIEWYGGDYADILVGTQRSEKYREYSFVDQQKISEQGIINLVSSVYDSTGNLICSDESYVSCQATPDEPTKAKIKSIYPAPYTNVDGLSLIHI